MECIICGVNDTRIRLYKAVTKDGIVHVCENCCSREDIPVIKGSGKGEFSERNQTVYDRLSKMAGLDPLEHKAKFEGLPRNERVRRQNEALKRVVNQRGELSFPSLKYMQPERRADLVDNYHWAILNARRARRISQQALAEAIAEPEISVKLVERGILPDNYIPFMKKIQSYLGITLFSQPVYAQKTLGFDKFTSNQLKVSDLHEMQENSEKPATIPYWKKFVGFLQRRREKRKQEESRISGTETKESDALAGENKNPEQIGENAGDIQNQQSLQVQKTGSVNPDISQEDMNKLVWGKR